ncbi:MAG: sigma-70 family RNA polymerase sigma factor [Anaerolineae bacterium]|nr:sigma-70 family RNA polymerase sigma factor [Anaerolineae bacterium]
MASLAQQGDLAAFNVLVQRYQSLAYNVTYRITGDADLASDATQEALILAYRKIGQFRGGSFRAWLARIATNCAYDQLRSRQRHRASSIEDLVEEHDRVAELVDDRVSPEDAALGAELSRAIAAAVLKLPPDQRSVIVLVDFNQFNYDEAADALGLSLGTVKSRLSRARGRVREMLLEHPELLPAGLRP